MTDSLPPNPIRPGADWQPIVRGYEDILYHHATRAAGKVAKLTINRPEVHNAFTPKTVQELRDALQHAAPGLPPERYPELGQRYRHHYLASQHALVLFPGTLQMLQALKARQHLLAVATGKNRRGLDEALSHSQMHGVFDATRTADETAGKPHPLMLQELMAELGVPPERTLMIGDTTHDLQLARNAGTARVAVSYGAHEPEAFAAYEPLFIAHSTAELNAWLAAHG